MKPILIRIAILSVFTVSLFGSFLQASILIFDPFDLHFEQIKQELASITTEQVVKANALDESIFLHTTSFLLLSESPNQSISGGGSYKLTLKDQELLVEYLNQNKNIHLYATPNYSEYDSLQNPLYCHLGISYAGAYLVGVHIDSAWAGTTLFKNEIKLFQIYKNDNDLTAITHLESPIINAPNKISLLKGVCNFELSAYYPTPKGKIIIDLFYFLDYVPYLRGISEFYRFESTPINGFSLDNKTPYVVMQLRDRINISFALDKGNNPVTISLRGINGKQYFFTENLNVSNYAIDITRIPAGVYILNIHDTFFNSTQRILTITR